ncbi:MAG: hypothetical protein H0V64_15755 [Geodermatophilaceae bacterium]|nr:hypothetical protein [Geodermatophilaceae bacterium]MDQ3464757.1 hypothetical protein [Actinomycetota bacterium]
MTGHGTLAEEARRLAEAFSDWSHDHPVGLAADEGTPETCRYCPLCQLIAVVRGQRPEVTARLAESGAAFLDALRSLVTPPDGGRAEEASPPTVQHIDVD